LRALGRHVLVAAIALASTGCPGVDLGENPPDPPTCRPDQGYFEDVIWPEYLAPADTARSCVDATGCHRSSDGRGALRLDINDPASNYAIVTRFLNCGSPLDSSLWTKPVSRVTPHGGGDLFDEAELRMLFEDWFLAP
jgi:hypothetical protein